MNSGVLSISISTQYYIKYSRKVKEYTNSSIPGLHFFQRKDIALSNEISKVHDMLTQICFQYGDDFECWIKGQEAIIYKISGVIRTDKLISILVFEADFIFSDNIYFRSSLTKRAETSVVPPQKKYGGRSRKT